MSLEMLMQHLINAMSLGSLYALLAIGYTMVYGILRLINFAHGDIFMVATYFFYYGVLIFTLPWYLSFPAAVVLTTILGTGVERLAYRPLRDAPRISILISAIGVSFFLENLATVVFGGKPKSFPTPEIFSVSETFGNVNVQRVSLIIPVVTLICLVALQFLVTKTKSGMAMRAVSKDVETARLMGVNVNKVIAFTFAIGSALASIGGILWGMKYPQILPLMGILPGLKCFIAAVVGGIGSIHGAVIGGFVLGFTEIMVVALMPSLSGYRDAFAFILLIVILLVKPTGIIGERISEKV